MGASILSTKGTVGMYAIYDCDKRVNGSESSEPLEHSRSRRIAGDWSHVGFGVWTHPEHGQFDAAFKRIEDMPPEIAEAYKASRKTA